MHLGWCAPCRQEIEVEKEIKEGSEVIVAHVMLTQLEDTDETPIPLGIATVLDQYADVFENPTELPPDRLCNHKITLMPGAKPVNLRPHRYSYFLFRR